MFKRYHLINMMISFVVLVIVFTATLTGKALLVAIIDLESLKLFINPNTASG